MPPELDWVLTLPSKMKAVPRLTIACEAIITLFGQHSVVLTSQQGRTRHTGVKVMVGNRLLDEANWWALQAITCSSYLRRDYRDCSCAENREDM